MLEFILIFLIFLAHGYLFYTNMRTRGELKQRSDYINTILKQGENAVKVADMAKAAYRDGGGETAKYNFNRLLDNYVEDYNEQCKRKRNLKRVK